MAIDLADAEIRSAVKSGGDTVAFTKNFLLRVNFVGIGRCVVAVGTDVVMGIKRSKLRNERIALYSEQLLLMNAKIYYLQADSWLAAETTEKTIEQAMEICEKSLAYFIESFMEIKKNLAMIGPHINDIRENNPEFADEMLRVIKRKGKL